MAISCLGSFVKDRFDMLKSIGVGDLFRLFQVGDNLIGSTLINFCEIWLGDCLRCKFRDDQ